MQTLREAIEEARDRGVALGHFNVSDSNQLNGIVAAAQTLNVPVIIGVSEGERVHIGTLAVAALVRSLRAHDAPVYLNADHTKTLEGIREVIDAQFDAAIFDGSHELFEDNVQKTRDAVSYAHEKKASGEVLVEGEIGRIGTSSKLLDTEPEDVDAELTSPDEAARFVRETGVDLLAPAVGTMHGKLKNGPLRRIDVKRIAEIREAAGVPIVLHGGSGSSDEDFVAAIKAGISVVHINTDIRVAYRKGIEEGLAKNADEIAPYKYLAPAVESVRVVTEKYLRLFSGK